MSNGQFPVGGRVPDEVLHCLHSLLKRQGLLGHASDLAGGLNSARNWLICGVVVTGSLASLLESVVRCAPPPSTA